MRKRFIVNLQSGVIHDVRHSGEQCNLDDMDPWSRGKLGSVEVAGLMMAEKRVWEFCKHCWPDSVEG